MAPAWFWIHSESWLARTDHQLHRRERFQCIGRDGLMLFSCNRWILLEENQLYHDVHQCIIVLLLVLLLSFASIKVLYEYGCGAVFFLGRFQAVKELGLFLIAQVVRQIRRVDLRIIITDVPSQDVISRDNVSVKVNVVIYFRVVDPERSSSRSRVSANHTAFSARAARFRKDVRQSCSVEPRHPEQSRCRDCSMGDQGGHCGDQGGQCGDQAG